ncbi:non-homologous end joining protein Ku [Allorhizobium taibaishanense]|uniref:Non-homologous end joining protein Ku n=1 Tax=Allorhizobium taibaishanense TaxID=887144 RepID=A0A1Q9A6N3_9HYPH|nr:Ku protein [Allorhizobium taibaishanense]MBB4008600.1 DNA end-binding protein Ku [Allorhizobium taibaishanense]OLP50258.1 Ku protein [Allorhizobium taibaishanense]
MAGQTSWRGHLKLSLVTAAVTLAPARSPSNRVRFNILNAKTGNRVESRYIDSVTHKPVADRNQVHGFPRGEDDFVLLEDDEIRSVGLESTRAINIERFVPRQSIDWIWYDSPHFLLPADKIGAEAYCVIREAMKVRDVVGISRLVLYRREHAVLLEPVEKGIILWTLRYGEEVREPVDVLDTKAKIDKKALSTVEATIAKQKIDWRPALVQDPVQKRIKALLKTKAKTAPKPSAKAERKPDGGGKVINIMDALKESLAAERRR